MFWKSEALAGVGGTSLQIFQSRFSGVAAWRLELAAWWLWRQGFKALK
jgi:hypothetical protein